MSFENVRAYFESINMEDRVKTREKICDTVENAALSVGCKPAEILKTMSFYIHDKPALICMAGDAKISNPKFKAHFGVKAKMIPWDQVEPVIGHEPGGVCAFGINDNIDVYVDISVRRFEIVHSAAGSHYSTVDLSPEELFRYASAKEWIDVCKDWE